MEYNDPSETPVFVAGAGRSGTTAMVHMLNTNPQCCIGIERFKLLLLKGEPTNELFREHRFFDFRSSDTNLLPGRAPWIDEFYESLQKRFKSAQVLGDKVPNLAQRYGSLAELYPAGRIVHLVREPSRVAASSARRADDPDDPWSNDVRELHAVNNWLRQNHEALSFYGEHPEAIHFVHYEEIFSTDCDTTLDDLAGFLDIEVTPEMRAACTARASKFGNQPIGVLGELPNDVPPEMWARVEARYQELCELR